MKQAAMLERSTWQRVERQAFQTTANKELRNSVQQWWGSKLHQQPHKTIPQSSLEETLDLNLDGNLMRDHEAESSSTCAQRPDLQEP